MTLVRIGTAGIAILACVCAAAGQRSPAFEAASIHPNPSGEEGSVVNFPDTGRLGVTNATLKTLICAAWGVQNDQIVGGPKWLDTDRYNIEAKTAGRIRPDREQPLMQDLLIDRFRLRVHRETRELTAYALRVAKNGPLFKPNTSGSSSIHTSHGPGKSRITVTGIPVGQFAGMLGKQLGRIVVDQTGLRGNYDFSLQWDPDQTADSPVASIGPSLFTALQEQMGLRLESQKTRGEVLAIDSAEKASEN